MVQVGTVHLKHDKKANIIYINESYPQAEQKPTILSFNANDFFKAVKMAKDDQK